jgi:hypothetical protein
MCCRQDVPNSRVLPIAVQSDSQLRFPKVFSSSGSNLPLLTLSQYVLIAVFESLTVQSPMGAVYGYHSMKTRHQVMPKVLGVFDIEAMLDRYEG